MDNSTSSAFHFRSHFKEADDVIALIKDLVSVTEKDEVQSNGHSVEKNHNNNTSNVNEIKLRKELKTKSQQYDHLVTIIKQYQEQPGLLDSHLESIMQILLFSLYDLLVNVKQLRQQHMKSEIYSDRTKNNKMKSPSQVDEILGTVWYVSSLLYTICIVRRPKAAITVFPTDVHLLEPILEAIEDLLEIKDPQTYDTTRYYEVLTAVPGRPSPKCMEAFCDPTQWRLLYVLLMWLSLLILIPFGFADFSTRLFKDETATVVERNIPERVLTLAKECLRYPSAIQNSTSFVISKLFCRPDIYSTTAPSIFLAWLKSNFIETIDRSELTLKLGCLKTIKAILKSVGRSNLESVLPAITELLLKTIPSSIDLTSNSTSVLIKSFHTACIGRLALRYLPIKLASWRHLRGRRKLMCGQTENISPIILTSLTEEVQIYHRNNDNNDQDSCSMEQVEIIIDLLLQQLGCQTTVVRWSSAKALGRVVQHLSNDFGEQVVESIFELLESSIARQQEEGCNGACLALAELSRRGCLLPSRLGRLIPPLCKAIQYESFGPSSNCSSSAIRDAACFVCWAIARAFNSDVLQPHVSKLTEALVIVALFDRDVNCRRAASAAIQEHVGRQGIFPQGIPLVTIADYFGLATMRSSYLRVAPQIAQFHEYQPSIIKCLIDSKLKHPERNVRELSARSLQLSSRSAQVHSVESNTVKAWLHKKLFGAFSLRQMGEKICTSELTHLITNLAKRIHDCSVEERHGSLLGIAGLINCLSSRIIQKGEIEESLITELRNIVPQVERQRLYRGRGGELTREACYRVLSAISYAVSWISFKLNTSERYYQTLVEGLRNFSEHVQLAATEALHLLATHRATNDQIITWGNAFLVTLSNPTENIAARRGLTLGLGVLPWNVATYRKAIDVLKFLCVEATSKAPNKNIELNDPQTRQSAVIGISFVLNYLKKIVDCQTRENSLVKCSTNSKEQNEVIMPSKASDNSCNGIKNQEKSTDSLSYENEADHELIAVPLDLVCMSLGAASTDDQFDRRGDVGSWVRESAIEVIAYILETFPATRQTKEQNSPGHVREHELILSTYQVLRLFNCILRQTMDKFDRTRGRATFLAYRLINHSFLASSISCFGDKCQMLPQIHPEWLFRRAYYSFSYEISCGRVCRTSHSGDTTKSFDKRAGNKQSEDAENYDVASQKTNFQFSVECLPNREELRDALNRILDTDIEAPYLSDKGLGLQSCLAPQPQVDTEFANEGGGKVSDVEDEDDVDEFSNGDTSLGTFVAWQMYNYATQRFHKAGVTLKIPQFSRSHCVIPHLLPLLQLRPYADAILAGATNAIGVPLGFVSRAASNALLSLLQKSEKEQPFQHNGAREMEEKAIGNQTINKWIVFTLCHVGVVASQQYLTVKGYSSTPSSLNKSEINAFSESYRSVGFASILKTLALLFQNDLGYLIEVSPLLPLIIESISLTSDFTILRPAIELCCGISTCREYANNSIQCDENDNNQSKARIRRKALQCAVQSLKHKFPVIRQHTAEQLFARFVATSDDEFLSLCGRSLNVTTAEILSHLLSTSWALLEDEKLNEAVGILEKTFNFE